MSSRPLALLAMLTVGLAPVVARAQPLPEPQTFPRVLKGRVLSDANRAPLAGAEVVLMDYARLARTGPSGAFTLNVPDGAFRLQVRRIGYLSKAFRFRTRADTMEIEFALTPSAVVLDSLTVAGKTERISARLADFDRRRKVSATGQFLGTEELALHRDQSVADALRNLRGLRIVPSGNGQSAISIRGNAGTDPNALNCFMSVWVDGIMMSTPGRPFDLGELRVDRLGGVEVYTGPSELPIEFQSPAAGGCGAILVWTRER